MASGGAATRFTSPLARPNSVLKSTLFGLFLAALGAWSIATRRGAHAWYSNLWRIGSVSDSWFATLLGPRIVSALAFIFGATCIVYGALIALRIL